MWVDHRDGILGALLCLALPVMLLFGTTLMNDYRARQSSSQPVRTWRTEGTIIGFVGGSSKLSTGVSAYFKTTTNTYGFAGLPFFSGCHDGDRIFLTEQQSGQQVQFTVRPPGCERTVGQ
jgi:hypothetical protein